MWTGELGGYVVGGGVGQVVDCLVSSKFNVGFNASELVEWILRKSREESPDIDKRGWEEGRESMGDGFGVNDKVLFDGDRGAEGVSKKDGEGESSSSGISPSISRYSTSPSSSLGFEPLCPTGGTQLDSSPELPIWPCCDSANSSI